MSARAKAMQSLYRRGMVSIDGLRQAVADGVITGAEFTAITGQEYGA